jgi:hypothetical protein
MFCVIYIYIYVDFINDDKLVIFQKVFLDDKCQLESLQSRVNISSGCLSCSPPSVKNQRKSYNLLRNNLSEISWYPSSYPSIFMNLNQGRSFNCVLLLIKISVSFIQNLFELIKSFNLIDS